MKRKNVLNYYFQHKYEIKKYATETGFILLYKHYTTI